MRAPVGCAPVPPKTLAGAPSTHRRTWFEPKLLRACDVVDIGIGSGRGLGPSPGARLMGTQSTLFWHKAQNVSHESPAAQDPSLRLGCSARRLRKTPSCKLCHPRGHARVGWAPAYVSLLAGRLRSGIRYVRMRMLAGRLRSAGCARTYALTPACICWLGTWPLAAGPQRACVRTYCPPPRLVVIAVV